MSRFLLLALIFLSWKAYSESVPLVREGGAYLISVTINNKIPLNFTLDSGAADVCIPADVYSTLKRMQTIGKEDLLDVQTYVLADGSTQSSRRFRIRSLRVGGIELRDVMGSVCPSNATPLLGQSFLGRLSSWSIDNKKPALIIDGSPNPAAADVSETQGSAATPQAAAGEAVSAPAPQVEQTRYEEVTSKYTVKGVTALIDLSHVTFDYGDIRRTWVWLMLGPDAKQEVGSNGRMLSYRYLLAFDCTSKQVRAESLVERYEKVEVSFPSDQLPKQKRSWNKAWSGDYDSSAMNLICSPTLPR